MLTQCGSGFVHVTDCYCPCHFSHLELKKIFLSLGKTVWKGFIAVKTPWTRVYNKKHITIHRNTIPWLAPTHGATREKPSQPQKDLKIWGVTEPGLCLRAQVWSWLLDSTLKAWSSILLFQIFWGVTGTLTVKGWSASQVILLRTKVQGCWSCICFANKLSEGRNPGYNVSSG